MKNLYINTKKNINKLGKLLIVLKEIIIKNDDKRKLFFLIKNNHLSIFFHYNRIKLILIITMLKYETSILSIKKYS